MEPPADGQIHHRLDGGVQQFEHQHGGHCEHQHRQLNRGKPQPERQAEHHAADADVDAEVALANEAVAQALGGIAEAGGQVARDLPGSAMGGVVGTSGAALGDLLRHRCFVFRVQQ